MFTWDVLTVYIIPQKNFIAGLLWSIVLCMAPHHSLAHINLFPTPISFSLTFQSCRISYHRSLSLDLCHPQLSAVWQHWVQVWVFRDRSFHHWACAAWLTKTAASGCVFSKSSKWTTQWCVPVFPCSQPPRSVFPVQAAQEEGCTKCFGWNSAGCWCWRRRTKSNENVLILFSWLGKQHNHVFLNFLFLSLFGFLSITFCV